MRPIAELMRPDVPVVPPEAPVRRVTEVMVEAEVDGVLVVDARGRLVGSIGDEQLVAGLHAGRHWPWWRQLMEGDHDGWLHDRTGSLAAADIMLTRVITVDPGLAVRAAIRLFDEYAVNVLPVVDHGRLLGGVFRRDLVKRLFLPHP